MGPIKPGKNYPAKQNDEAGGLGFNENEVQGGGVRTKRQTVKEVRR